VVSRFAADFNPPSQGDFCLRKNKELKPCNRFAADFNPPLHWSFLHKNLDLKLPVVDLQQISIPDPSILISSQEP
jgi:hypothetical protein